MKKKIAFVSFLILITSFSVFLALFFKKYDEEDNIFEILNAKDSTNNISWIEFMIGSKLLDLLDFIRNLLIPDDIRAIQLSTDYWKSYILKAILDLKLIDTFNEADSKGLSCKDVREVLKERDGIMVDQFFLCRLIKAGTSIGLFKKQLYPSNPHTTKPVYKYLPTSLGNIFSIRNKDNIYSWANMITDETGLSYHLLTDVVREGKSGFSLQTGKEIWDYYQNDNPADGIVFNKAMENLSSRFINPILDNVDFRIHNRICDIGGGYGTILSYIFDQSQNDNQSGVVFDIPHIKDQIHSFLSNKGLSNRIDIVSGDFFDQDTIPDSCDAYIIKSVLQDWSDYDSIKILSNVASKMSSTDRLYLFEVVIDGHSSNFIEKEKRLLDILMMVVGKAGARQRTLIEFTAIIKASGLKLVSHSPTKSVFSILEVQKISN